MKKMIFTLFLIATVLATQAQFEKKVTMQLSGGYSILQGDLTKYYNNGITIDGGLQYNFNRSFSLVTLIKYGTYFINEETVVNITGKYNNLGISFCPKYKFLKDNSFSPYIFGGANINHVKYSFEFDGGSNEHISPICFGYLGGAGADLKINESLALFTQFGYNHIKFKEDDFENDVNSIFIQLGANINIFKSKSL